MYCDISWSSIEQVLICCLNGTKPFAPGRYGSYFKSIIPKQLMYRWNTLLTQDQAGINRTTCLWTVQHATGPFEHRFSVKTIIHYLDWWGRVTHICVGKLTIIGSDNGLSPGRRQAIIRTNAGILLIGTLGTNFSEILSEPHTFSFKKMHLKMSSGRWRPFCLGLNVLTFEMLYMPSFTIPQSGGSEFDPWWVHNSLWVYMWFPVPEHQN